MELTMDGAYEEASINSPQQGIQRASRWMNTSMYWEGDAPQLLRDRGSCPQDLPRPHPTHLFIWLCICPFTMSFNEVLNLSERLPGFCGTTHSQPTSQQLGTYDQHWGGGGLMG